MPFQAACLVVPVAASLAAASFADIIQLDIDPIPGMVNLPGQIVPAESKLSDQFLPQGVLVSSTASFSAVAAGEGVHWIQDPELRNGVGGVSSNGQLDYTMPVILQIVAPCNPAAMATTTWFSLYTDYQGDGGFCSLTAYDADDAIVDVDAKSEHVGAAATGTQYAVAGPGIVKVVFIGAATQAVSNFELEAPVPVTGCDADFNLDGIVDGDDLGTLLGQWGLAEQCTPADFNHDGIVDGDDLGTLLGEWGLCG